MTEMKKYFLLKMVEGTLKLVKTVLSLVKRFSDRNFISLDQIAKEIFGFD